MDINEILKVAKELNELILKEKQSIPYSINLIDELHINIKEIAHSSILNMLLQYSHNGQYVILRSFVEMIKKINPTTNISVQSPKCTCEKERIDLLIIDSGKAIIIENKVNNAVDQHEQIKRYFDIVKNSGIKEEDIYAIYLTRDGNKEVSDDSLPDETKKILNYGKENSRFIPLNYKDHILPWLENDVLPNCALKEDLLITALKQYIDFLKGLLNLRLQQLQIQEKMDNFTKEKLEIESLEEAISIKNNVKRLSESIDSIAKGMINKIAKDKILSPLNSYLSKFKQRWKVEVDYNVFYLFVVRIKPSNWNKCCIAFAFEKESTGCIYGISHFDAQTPITSEAQAAITNLFPYSKGFRNSDWWPCYKKMASAYSPNGIDYWVKVQSGKIDIFEKMMECIKEIYSKTKNFELYIIAKLKSTQI